MSSRKTSAIMNSSRPRTSVEAHRKPRHTSRTQSEITPSFPSYMMSGMTHQDFPQAIGSSNCYSEVSTYWPIMNESFFPGTDSAHIPTLSVAPMDLTHQPAWNNYDMDLSPPPSGSSSSSISPPMTQAEMSQHTGFLQNTADHYEPLQDQWIDMMNQMPMTPPEDNMFDHLEFFENVKTDSLAYPTSSEPATECEYLGVSKLQFSSAPSRHSQPRPIRSASERTSANASSGSTRSHFAKDDHVERVKNNPRNDPRYEEKADKDGYFHCPYATEGCNHKPTKQKCIYAKNLDSHLKPYTCKYGAMDENCRSLRFSSNACLFRHEREMHGMHNHGINPFLCKFPGCERARRDNGFPRRWNQRDHMKRVHGYEEVDSDESADRGYPDPAARRKKSSSSSHHVPMKRTSSSRAQANYYHGAQRNISRELQARNTMPGMNHRDLSYAPQQMMNQPYGNYVQPVY